MNTNTTLRPTHSATRHRGGSRTEDIVSAPYTTETADMIRAIKDHSGMNVAEIAEAARHGADAGWPGFTYTQDCVDFYNANEDAIQEWLHEDADNFGQTVPEMIAGFGRSEMADTPDGLANLLAWYALERAGHEFNR